MTILHWIGNFLRHQLDHVPLSTARWLMVGLYLILMFWIIQLPSIETNPPDRPGTWRGDLKIWAWFAIMFQIVIYSVF